MSTAQSPSRFLRRFDDVWARLRRVSGLKAVSNGVLMLLLGFTALVVSDFSLELPLNLRRLLLGAVVLGGLFVAFGWLLRIVRWWNAGNTAAEIERTFPELGQSVRTSIEFGRMSDSELRSAGIAPSLVENLQSQTDRRTLAIDLPAIVRTGTLIVTVGLACFLTGGLLTGSAVDTEWRTAVRRCLLGNEPYTTAAAMSGDMIVVQGQSALLVLELNGRVERDARLSIRPLSGEWETVPLTEAELKESSSQLRRYELPIVDIQEPFEYRFEAGPAATDIHQVTVRYPLQVLGFNVKLTPPSYTRLPEAVSDEASFTAIDGSQATIEITLDRAPAQATLMIRPAGSFAAVNAEAKTTPLQIDGSKLSMSMVVTDNWRYTLHAVDADGVEVRTEEASIRVRRDQSPRVWFEKPTEELEVHTLAEVMMRVRTSDDFGLSNAGIVFEINNESSHTLHYEDFAKAMEEAGTVDSPLKTNAVLEKLLPLEYFELTQRDSVSYFAFAEDNYPGGAHRTETELRFIDIRPFRQRYQLVDMEDPMGLPGENIMFLGDLIRRERALLNRTLRLAQRVKAGGAPETDTSDALIEEQQVIADGTRRLADFLVAMQFGGEELIFEAHEAMLGAITSLGDGRFDNAVAQERDAIKLLVEGRDVLRILIRKNPPKNRAALRAFSRRETQKLRRPKSDQQEVMELIERLTQLENEERRMSSDLASVMNGGSGSGQSQMNGSNGHDGSGSPKDANPLENNPDDTHKPEPGPKDTTAEPTRNGDAETELAASEKNGDAKTNADQSGSKTGEKTSDMTDTESDDSETGTGHDVAAKSADEIRREVEERQHAAALESRDIEAKMQQIPWITELARERMAEAAKMAETAAETLTRGEISGAMEQMKQTEQMLGELRRQAEALLKEEISQQIAAARDLASRLAQQQAQLQSQLNQQAQMNQQANSMSPDAPGSSVSQGQGQGQSGDGNGLQQAQTLQQPQTPEQMQAAKEALADAARRLAETGRTFEDVTRAIANAESEQDQESAAQVGRVRDEQQLMKQIEQMQKIVDQIEKDDLSGAQAAAGEVSQRLEVTAQELEQVHRRLVAPRLAKLMELEAKLMALVEKLNQLETVEDVACWHREAQELLDEIDQNQLGGTAVDQLRELLTANGNGSSSEVITRNWNVRNSCFAPPQAYTAATQDVAASLQLRIQEIFLGDMESDSGGAVPPEYEHLVERYYEVLSSGKDDH
ncbi:MAG: hypothetical protein KDA96_06780 [Planctomycetaceae bacterium]|nr:hypothetical protein [Planctomycetaceae bacterium]